WNRSLMPPLNFPCPSFSRSSWPDVILLPKFGRLQRLQSCGGDIFPARPTEGKDANGRLRRAGHGLTQDARTSARWLCVFSPIPVEEQPPLKKLTPRRCHFRRESCAGSPELS